MIDVRDFGAKGDGAADDTAAFQAAMAACANQFRLFVPAGHYIIRKTIVSSCRGIVGEASYVDTGNQGTRLTFQPAGGAADLLPCLKIEGGGVNAVYENFSVFGPTAYTVPGLTNWVNKFLFDQQQYGMFASGTASIEVAGPATPVFRNVMTRNSKVGLLLNNNVGHVTSRDCNWGGLIGLYVKKNNYDYTFERGNITGAFCGILIGVEGIGASFRHVHAGFSPYGIYQCINDGGANPTPKSLSGIFDFLNFEQCGEAAIKLLPNASTFGISCNGFGFSWSTHVQNGQGGWAFALPSGLLAENERQKYAAWLGILQGYAEFDALSAKLYRSSAPGAIGSALLHQLNTDGNLTGLGLEQAVILRKVASRRLNPSLLQTIGERQYRSINPVSGANLLLPTNDPSNWTVEGGAASLTVVTDLSALPRPMTNEMMSILGRNPVVFKITPDGTAAPTVKIRFNGGGYPQQLDPGRNLAVSGFVLTGTSDGYLARISSPGGKFLYGDILSDAANVWQKISNVQQSDPSGLYYELALGAFRAVNPTYFAGVMVTYDDPTPFSPYPHPYVDDSLELGDGLYLTDQVTGIRYKITIENGEIVRTPAGQPQTPPRELMPAKDYGYNTAAIANFAAKVKAGTGTTRILCLGDSISRGTGSSDETAKSWPMQLQTLMVPLYGNSGAGFIMASESDPRNDPTVSGPNGPYVLRRVQRLRTADGSPAPMDAAVGFGFGLDYAKTGKGIEVMFGKIDCDRFTVNYLDAPGGNGGKFSVWVDGSLKQDNIGDNSVTDIVSRTIAFTVVPGMHTISLRQKSANFNAAGILFEKGGSGIQISKIGRAGWKAADFAGSASSLAAYDTTLFDSWHQIPHDLMILSLGANDVKSKTPAQFKTDMARLITHAKEAGMDVLLYAGHLPGSNWFNNINVLWPAYVAAMHELADQYGCALVNGYEAWFYSYAKAQSLGLFCKYPNDYSGTAGNDPVHPSDKGHRYIAQTIFKTLRSVIE